MFEVLPVSVHAQWLKLLLSNGLGPNNNTAIYQADSLALISQWSHEHPHSDEHASNITLYWLNAMRFNEHYELASQKLKYLLLMPATKDVALRVCALFMMAETQPHRLLRVWCGLHHNLPQSVWAPAFEKMFSTKDHVGNKLKPGAIPIEEWQSWVFYRAAISTSVFSNVFEVFTMAHLRVRANENLYERCSNAWTLIKLGLNVGILDLVAVKRYLFQYADIHTVQALPWPELLSDCPELEPALLDHLLNKFESDNSTPLLLAKFLNDENQSIIKKKFLSKDGDFRLHPKKWEVLVNLTVLNEVWFELFDALLKHKSQRVHFMEYLQTTNKAYPGKSVGKLLNRISSDTWALMLEESTSTDPHFLAVLWGLVRKFNVALLRNSPVLRILSIKAMSRLTKNYEKVSLWSENFGLPSLYVEIAIQHLKEDQYNTWLENIARRMSNKYMLTHVFAWLTPTVVVPSIEDLECIYPNEGTSDWAEMLSSLEKPLDLLPLPSMVEC